MKDTTYPSRPERLVASHALEGGDDLSEIIGNLRARLEARRALVAAAQAALDLLNQLPSLEPQDALAQAAQVRDKLAVSLKAYEE